MVVGFMKTTKELLCGRFAHRNLLIFQALIARTAFGAADKTLGLIAALNAVIRDPRDADHIVHRHQDLVRQRIYRFGTGHEYLKELA